MSSDQLPLLLVDDPFSGGLPATLSSPTYMVEMALTDNLQANWKLDLSELDLNATLGGVYATAVFSAIAGFISAKVTHGRAQEDAQIQSSRLELRMSNSDGSLSPDNTSSPWYPNLISHRQIRLSAIYQGVTYRRFTGYIQSITPVDNSEMDGDVQITAYDWLGKSARTFINGSFVPQDAGARANALLNMTNDWGYTRTLDVGPESLLGIGYSTREGSGTAPTVKPTLSAAGTSGTLPLGTYAIGFTWIDANGVETVMSPAENVTITAGQIITVTLPTRPSWVVNHGLYISTAASSPVIAFLDTSAGTLPYNVTFLPAADALPPPVGQPSKVSVQQHMNDVMISDRGIFYVACDGSYHYENRRYRFTTPRSNSIQFTLAQPDILSGAYPPGTLPFTQLDYTFDDRDIHNDIHVKASNTTELEVIAQDTTSITNFDTGTLSIQSQVMPPAYAQYLAPWLLSGYKDQHSRISAVYVDGDSSDLSGGPTDMWVRMFSIEISDRIHIVKSRPASLAINRDMWIEGWTEDIKADLGGHTMAIQLGDPSAYGPTPWQLDLSRLDLNTVLGF